MRWVIAFFTCLWGQITIQSSDLPSPGSTYLLGQARPSSALDYAATGAGYTWNFSGLRADTHLLSEWKSISSVPQYGFLAVTGKSGSPSSSRSPTPSRHRSVLSRMSTLF